MTIQEKFNRFVAKNGHEPKYADCSIIFLDNEQRCDGFCFKLSCDTDADDDLIFFYCNGVLDLEAMTKKSAGEDFVIIPESVVFIDKL